MSWDVLGRCLGGERGIRTPDTLSGTSVFKTDAINHSASSPRGVRLLLIVRRKGAFLAVLPET